VLQYSDGDEEQSVDQENPWTGNACICSTLSPAYVVKLQEILAKLSSPPPPAPLRLPPIDVAGLVAQFRISIKDGRLSGGIWRSGPKWKSKVTSLIALFSTQFSDIIAELEAAGEMGRFDQVWPELAREQGGGKTLAMGRVAVIEATYMAPVGYTWTSWLAYIATTSNGYEEGGLAAREALAEKRRIMVRPLSRLCDRQTDGSVCAGHRVHPDWSGSGCNRGDEAVAVVGSL
jgi:hypothetical protein